MQNTSSHSTKWKKLEFSFYKGEQIKLVRSDFNKITLLERPSIAFLDPPFDFDYKQLTSIDADTLIVFARGGNVFEYLSEKLNNGYGYHCLVNLTPANGVNAPTMPSNTFEVIHVLRSANAYFDHDHALRVIGKDGKKAPGVMNFGRSMKAANYYKHAKPVKVFSYCLSYALEGSAVYDPFCGIGNSAKAALARGCYYIGTDTGSIIKKNPVDSLLTTVGYYF